MSSVRRRPVLLAALVVVAGLCLPASATEELMTLLPLSEPFNCAICHVPDSDARNAFGTAFELNSNLWDHALATLDSDEDGCTNGVELGDADGNGEADGGVEGLQSNPGVDGDCSGTTVDSRTWGELKALFDRN